MADFDIQVNAFGNNLYDNAAVVRNEKHAAVPSKDAEILQELQRVRQQLETTQPKIANALASLEEAVKAQDKPTIKKLLGEFASDTTKDILTSIASATLLNWMGIV